ncbi:MAG: winged helix DNA-binding domain-containing protein [Anaerolineae bacterium]|nr:winged helix DNA-binding domain-containing protein [Anaerolineales bacterium]MCQ3973571.1 winged helix DNA-binding domain-containing protein [Anaerolineae bacterium]
MTPQDIAHYRLANQHIADPHLKEPDQVVARLGALQAQDYAGAKWSIGLRLPDATEADIEQAIADKTIVRTWPMRGTLHFVAAADARWLLQLLTPRVIAQTAGRYRQLELDEAIFARSKELFAGALQGGQQLTRADMQQLLEEAGISTAGQRGYHILVRSAQDGLICFGVPQGKQQTFTLLDEWIAPTPTWERDEALAELANRYFTGHGPATIHDLAWWSGLTLTDARAGLEQIKAKLRSETINGQTYWLSPDTPALPEHSPTAYLLPGFDEYLLGYTDRSAVLKPEHAPKIVPGNNGMFMPTVVLDGQVAGLWKRTFKKDRLTLTLSPFTSFSPAHRQALNSAAERYRKFVGAAAVEVS